MATLEELANSKQTSSTSPSLASSGLQTSRAKISETEQLSLDLASIEALGTGAKQITTGLLQGTYAANTIRADDAYQNSVTGNNNIDKVYQDMEDERGYPLASSEIKSKMDWKQRYFKDVVDNSVDEEDATNPIYKERFLQPASKNLIAQQSADRTKFFTAFKTEKKNENSDEITSLGKGITFNQFDKYLSFGKQFNLPEYGETVSGEIASSLNVGMTEAELASDKPSVTYDELVNKYYDGKISYEDGTFSRASGFQELSDEGYNSMLNAIKSQYKSNTASNDDGTYNDILYRQSNDVVESYTKAAVTIPDDVMVDNEKEREKLRNNPNYTTSTSRRNGLEFDVIKQKEYNSNIQSIDGYIDAKSGSVKDVHEFKSNMNRAVDPIYGNKIDPALIKKRVLVYSDRIEKSIDNIKLNFSDPKIVQQGKGILQSNFASLTQNEQVTGEKPKIFSTFESMQQNASSVKALSLDNGFKYAQYLRFKAQNTQDEDLLRQAELLEQTIEASGSEGANQDIAKNTVNKLSTSFAITNNVKSNSPERVKVANSAIDGLHTKGLDIGLATMTTVESFQSSYLKANNRMSISDMNTDLSGRDTYRLGDFGILTSREEYTMMPMPRDVEDSDFEDSIEIILNSANKGRTEKLTEDDLIPVTKSYTNGSYSDIEYQISYNIGGAVTTYILNVDTIGTKNLLPTER